MSSQSQQQEQQQIMQACEQINQALQIPQQQFSLESLTHIQWYLTVLETIYPQLSQQFQKIRRMEDEGKAIDKMLVMLAKEEIIENDFLEIKGQDITEGDIESVYYIVQLLTALIKRETEQQEDGQEEQQQQQKQQQEQAQEQDQEEEEHTEEQEEQQLIEQSQINEQHYPQSFQPSQSPSPFKDQLQPSEQYPSQEQFPSNQEQFPSNQDNPAMFKNVFNHYDSQDQPSQQEERHSVLGIKNEFDDQEDEDNEDDQQDQDSANHRPIGGANSATFGQSQKQSINFQPFTSNIKQSPQQHLLPSNPTKNHPNIFNNNYQNTNSNQQQLSSNEMISTKNGYQQQLPKPIPQQNKKQFSSSEEDQQANSYQQHPSKPNKPLKAKQDSEEEDDNDYFINPTIKKYKSNPKLKTVGSGSKKTTQKKQKYQSPSSKIIQTKESRKLVIHPTIKKQYQKATNPQARKLTHEVKMNVSSTLKKKTIKQATQSTIMPNPTMEEMDRKRRQLRVKLTDYKQQRQIHNQHKLHSHTQQARSSMQLGKVLNWRQGQLKKQKEQFQKGMQMKLQVQKETYIKKINKLVIKLQKEKELQEKHEYKEKLFNQNQQAAKRLTAIEQWYKDKIQMLKQKNSNNRNQRTLMHTGHKEILKQIQKELKRDNEKQIMAMTMKYRKQEAEIENDIELLEREIIKVYKRN